jgi:hypothetical protein
VRPITPTAIEDATRPARSPCFNPCIGNPLPDVSSRDTVCD